MSAMNAWFLAAWALCAFLVGFSVGGLSILVYCARRLKLDWKADMHWAIHEWAEASALAQERRADIRADIAEAPTWQPYQRQPGRQQPQRGGW